MATSEYSTTTGDEVERLRAERDALRAEVEGLQRRRVQRHAFRRGAVVLLVILSCLSLVAATVAVWANRTLLRTDGWVATVEPLAGDPAVTAALEPRITEAIFSALPAQQLIADALPEDRAFLAIPLASAVESFVGNQVTTFLNSDAFARLWVEINATAHATALAVLRGDRDVVQVSDTGDVTLNLLPIVNQVLAQIGQTASGVVNRDLPVPEITAATVPAEARQRINEAFGIELPENIAQIPVYNAEGLVGELAATRDALELFDQARIALLILTPLLLVGALWLSLDRRRTLIQLSIGTLLLLVVGRRVLLRQLDAVSALPPRPEGQEAAGVITGQLSSGLFQLTALVMLIALIVLVVALISGPTPWAATVRRSGARMSRAVFGSDTEATDRRGAIAWMAAHASVLQIGGVVLVAAVLLVFNVSWGWFLAILAVLACWEFVLWRLGAEAASPADTPPDTPVDPSTPAGAHA